MCVCIYISFIYLVRVHLTEKNLNFANDYFLPSNSTNTKIVIENFTYPLSRIHHKTKGKELCEKVSENLCSNRLFDSYNWVR